MKCQGGTYCIYCDMLLSTRHEHDHFPTPKRHGGEGVFCVCINCHDLKDRVPMDHWHPNEAYKAISDLWPKMTPMQRILMAKMFNVVGDAMQQMERYGYMVETSGPPTPRITPGDG